MAPLRTESVVECSVLTRLSNVDRVGARAWALAAGWTPDRRSGNRTNGEGRAPTPRHLLAVSPPGARLLLPPPARAAHANAGGVHPAPARAAGADRHRADGPPRVTELGVPRGDS